MGIICQSAPLTFYQLSQREGSDALRRDKSKNIRLKIVVIKTTNFELENSLNYRDVKLDTEWNESINKLLVIWPNIAQNQKLEKGPLQFLGHFMGLKLANRQTNLCDPKSSVLTYMLFHGLLIHLEVSAFHK